jgi:3-oxoacyl-[acyl-carrier protein] reductase
VELGLAGKTFVVCGASRGIGRAVAEILVAEGASVLAVARSPEPAATELGERAVPCAADLDTAEGVDTLVAAAIDELGAIDGVLVNGGGPAPGRVLEVSDGVWEHSYRSLLGHPIRIVRGLRAGLKPRASIVFVTASSFRVPIPGLDVSNVLRPAVVWLAKCLALELAPIRVNAIAPGFIDTDRARSVDELDARLAGLSLEEQRHRIAHHIALARYGEPAEVGRVAGFLLSEAASYLTGAVVEVDGGYLKLLD